MQPLILREDLSESPPTLTGRRLRIRVCTYGRVYEMGQGRTALRERIQPGAFREPLARPRGALRFRHQGERPGDVDVLENFYGVMTGMDEGDGDALFAEFDVFPGEREDKLLQLIQYGAVRGASMSALIKASKAGRDTRGPLVDIIRVGAVDAVSITPKPGYDDAEVVAVRERRPAPDRARLAAEAAYWATVKLPGR